MENEPKKKRGFASMDKETQRRIASMGGKAVQQAGLGHQFTPEQAREAGRKGGLARSQKVTWKPET